MKYCSILLLLFIVSCNTIDVYEKNKLFSTHSWKEAEKPSFNFNVTDTAGLYNLFLVFRHHDSYRYNNLWVNIVMNGPADSFNVRREFILSNNAQGWLGSGMDDIYEHRIPFNTTPAPLKKGTYTFTLQQKMREDPLEHVLNVGIRVEKVKQPL